MADTLIELAERCEKAVEPDRELDRAIWLALCGPADRQAYEEGLSISQSEADFRAEYMMDGRSFTASLDAALTLVPDGYWHGYHTSEDGFIAHCFEQVVDSSFHKGKAGAPARALCAAALRARAAMESAAWPPPRKDRIMDEGLQNQQVAGVAVSTDGRSAGLRPEPAAPSQPKAAVTNADSGWQPISTAPLNTPVDLWCVDGYEPTASYWTGASIGRMVPRRHKSAEYGWFGNQSNDGVPRGHASDMIPVAWRPTVPDCPAELIAEVLGIPVSPCDSGSDQNGEDAPAAECEASQSGAATDSASPEPRRTRRIQ